VSAFQRPPIVNNNEKTMELSHKGPFFAGLARCAPQITME
jgi:hypothetical protein